MEEEDGDEKWIPPESTNDVYPVTANFTSGHSSFISTAPPAASSYNHSYNGGHYRESADRIQPAHYPQPSYQMASSQHVYQPATSSYERMSPIDYRELPSGSDAISSYSSLQVAEGSQLVSAVDSSTLNHSGYQLQQVVMDSGQRVVTIQRVVSPVDCTVSQSALSNMQDRDSQQPTHAILTPVPVSSVQRYQHLSSYSEVTTTEDVRLGNEALPNTDGDLSSARSSYQSSRMSHLRKERDEPECGEPDTTQDDRELESYQHAQHVQSYMIEEPSSIEDTEPELHSTIPENSGSGLHCHPNRDVIDSSLDSTQLSSSQGHQVVLSATNQPIESTVVDTSVLHSEHVTQAVAIDASLSNVEMQHLNVSCDDEPQQVNIRLVPVTSVPIRKSTRLAELENEVPSWQRPSYKPKPYNFNELWCEDCMTSYPTECPTHRLTLVPDKIVLSRAWASLPPMLQIFRLGEPDTYTNEPHVGVFAKRVIQKNTQFGPFIGELVSRENIMHSKFPLAIERASGEISYFDTSDENKCNWMMFLRPAESYAEQNTVAYQYGLDIYFTVTRNIDCRSELKVWYAPHYAERFGFPNLEITDQDIRTLDDQECKFACYECPERFRTQMALQRHIMTHEASSSGTQRETKPFIGQSTQEEYVPPSVPETSTSSTFNKKKGRSAKKVKDIGETYMWKKKSTSFYLSRTLKKYHKKPNPEQIRKNLMNLYRKKGKDNEANELTCTHCDLTFDTSNMLTLHTFTHATEEVDAERVRQYALTGVDGGMTSLSFPDGSSYVSLNNNVMACPVCHLQFLDQKLLIQHAAVHGTMKRKFLRDRPYKCEKCGKAFFSQDRLQRHTLCHGDEASKPLQCTVCFKRFMNNSALSCHLKIHSDKKYYSCPVCHEGFDHANAMKLHVIKHSVNGVFECPECERQFEDFFTLRKHLRSFHSNKEYPCPECKKVFPRPDKLKLHMLRHSNHREFMCETCGRQFKRKDKLKEHIRRMHAGDKDAKGTTQPSSSSKKFVPKVAPTDFHRFIYKCHLCMLGFKRRGMLVNHLAKRHPDIQLESVPELNLPILKTQKDYYCQYCDKIYKSSSKRKAHIIKNHPGSVLPLSARKKVLDIPGLPNPTYSQTVGSITTMPHACEFCHKQYASKAKLTQHQRNKHPEMVVATTPAKNSKMEVQPPQEPHQSQEHVTSQEHVQQPIQHLVRFDHENGVVAIQQTGAQDGILAADLLTQAMSELTQTLHPVQEYRTTPGDFHLPARSAAPTMVQVQSLQHPHSTIELSHLGQTLSNTHFIQRPGTVTGSTVQLTAIASTPVTTPEQAVSGHMQETSPSQSPLPDQSGQENQSPIIVTTAQGVSVQTIPVSSLPPGTFITQNWPGYRFR